MFGNLMIYFKEIVAENHLVEYCENEQYGEIMKQIFQSIDTYKFAEMIQEVEDDTKLQKVYQDFIAENIRITQTIIEPISPIFDEI